MKTVPDGVPVPGSAQTSVHNSVANHAERIGTDHDVVPMNQVRASFTELADVEAGCTTGVAELRARYSKGSKRRR